ncbi:MAG: HEAT repeat domain-containing protein [Geobacter sp.]|nr:HEAT repeat domain-containing protein [Geobacter sp.]
MTEPVTATEMHPCPEAAFVAELLVYRRTALSYPASHPAVAAAAQQVLERLSLLTAKGAFVLGVGRHALLANGDFIERKNPRFGEFASLLSSHGIMTLAFWPELTPPELQAFFDSIARPCDEVWEEGGMETALARTGISHIRSQGIDPSLFRLAEKPGGGKYENPWDRFLKMLMSGAFPVRRDILLRMLAEDSQYLAEEVTKVLEQLPPTGKQASLQTLATAFAGISTVEDPPPAGKTSLDAILSFVFQLTPELRKDFIAQLIIASRDDTRFPEALLERLPHDAFLDALNATQAYGDRLPPLVLKLLQKLATVATEEPAPPAEAPSEVLGEKITTLLKQQQLEEYLPPAYRDVLFALLSTDQLPDGDQCAIEALAATLDPDHLERHTAEVIVEIMKKVPAGERAAGISANVAEMAPMLLETGDLATLSRLAEAAHSEGTPPPFATEEFTREILQAAAFFEKEQYPLLSSILAALGESAIPPLLERLADADSRLLRGLILKSLQNIGPAVCTAAIARLDDKRPSFVRDLLMLLRSFPDEEVLREFRRLVSHPDPNVRREALRSALFCRDPGAERLLFQELASGNAERMRAAVQSAEAARSPAVVRELLNMVTKRTAMGYNLELRRTAVQTLSAIGDPQVIPELETFIAERDILHPVKSMQLKLEVIRSLRRYAAPEARTLLQHLASNKRPKVAEEAAAALRAPRGGKT